MKGWEVSKGQFVVVEEAELEALEGHDDSRSIEISQFVPVEEIDPIWRDRTYYLVPGATAAQRRPYRLLLEAMRETGTGALGRFVRSGRESLCLVRARGDSLVLETLYLAEDVYSDAEIAEAVGETEVKAPELALAHQIIDSLAGEFEPATLTSSYRRDLRRCSRRSSRAWSCRRRASPRSRRHRPSTCSRRSRRASRRRRAGKPAAKPASKAKKPAAKSRQVTVARLQVAARSAAE